MKTREMMKAEKERTKHRKAFLRTFDQKLEDVRNLAAIQGREGNWDYDEYMRGLYNGLELALCTLEEREPKFRDALGRWERAKRRLVASAWRFKRARVANAMVREG